MKVIQNIPDAKYTGLFLLYFTAYNGDTTESNNSIKKLIVPATFNKVGQETGSRSCQKVKEILITRAILPGASSPVSGYKQHVPQAVEAPHAVLAVRAPPNGKRFQFTSSRLTNWVQLSVLHIVLLLHAFSIFYLTTLLPDFSLSHFQPADEVEAAPEVE